MDLEQKLKQYMDRGRFVDDGLPSDAGMDRAETVAKKEPVLGGGRARAPRHIDRGLENVFGQRQAPTVAKQAEPEDSIRAQLSRIFERTKAQLFKSVGTAPKRPAAGTGARMAGLQPASKSSDFHTVLADLVERGHVPRRRPVQKSDPSFDRVLRRLAKRAGREVMIKKSEKPAGEGRRVVVRT